MIPASHSFKEEVHPSIRPHSKEVRGLVKFGPDHATVLRVKDLVRQEIEEWDAFVEKEAKDLAEYERLKEKFGDSRS